MEIQQIVPTVSKKISFTSAMARMEWTKYAEQVYGEDWKAVYQAAFREELR